MPRTPYVQVTVLLQGRKRRSTFWAIKGSTIKGSKYITYHKVDINGDSLHNMVLAKVGEAIEKRAHMSKKYAQLALA